MQDLKQMLENNHRKFWKTLAKKNQDWIAYLNANYPFSSCLHEQLYLFANQIKDRPICPVDGCTNHVNWINTNHYGITCSQKCSQQYKKQTGRWEEIQQKMAATMMTKYGVENACQNSEVIAKRNNTMMEKYGALVSPNTRESAKSRAADMNTKARKTIKAKYGVDNSSQIPGIQEKKVKTMEKNYGVSHPSKIPHVQEARASATLHRYTEMSKGAATILSWNQADLELQNLYDNPNPRITFKCDACHHVEELAMETFKWRVNATGTPCIKCSQINKGSFQERQIREYVQSLGVDIISNDRKLLRPYEIDILIPSHSLAIEYCGLYWHSELHGITQNKHLDKMKSCKQKGVNLITIFEDEWIHKKIIVKSIIKSLLGLEENIIEAHDVVLKKITTKEVNRFCNEYHIQGVGKTNHAYGLFHSEELLSVMTFSKCRRGNTAATPAESWELNRYCIKDNVKIVGGPQLLLNAFIQEITPIQIVGYSDRRWSEQVYDFLGFSAIQTSGAKYWYIDFQSMQRVHRYSLKKNQADNPQLTEWENRKSQGWNRIWDCGTTKWVWNKKEE